MKKRLILVMSLVFALSFAACGNDTSKVEVIEPGTEDVLEESEVDTKKEALDASVQALVEKKAEVLEKYNNGVIPESEEMDTILEQTQVAIDVTNEALGLELTVADVDQLQESIDLLDSSLEDLLETFKED